MSKYVKELVTNELRERLTGVDDALLVNVIGIPNEQNVALRRRLREKDIHLLVVKNSLAQRATEGTALAPAFEGAEGTMAVLWGTQDIVSLAKEVVDLAQQKEFAPFAPRGGVMDGQRLTADDVEQVSKWPSRDELLGIVAGQLVGAGSEIAAQLVGPAQQLASQVEKLIEMKEQAGE